MSTVAKVVLGVSAVLTLYAVLTLVGFFLGQNTG